MERSDDQSRPCIAKYCSAGGAESWSLFPMAGYKSEPNPWMVDHLPQIYMGMGLTAEEGQRKYGVTRANCDQFAYRSHQNALRAQAEGKFGEEIVAVEVEAKILENGHPEHHSRTFQKDEGPPTGTSLA